MLEINDPAASLPQCTQIHELSQQLLQTLENYKTSFPEESEALDAWLYADTSMDLGDLNILLKALTEIN